MKFKVDSEQVKFNIHSFSHKHPMSHKFLLSAKDILVDFEKTRLLLA